MSKTARIALLVSGPTRPDLLLSLPALARRLGPVMASSYQQASRVVNALRQGEPARTGEALEAAKVILCAGAPASEMATSLECVQRSWRGALVLFAGPPETDPAPVLARQGARVATVTLMPSARGKAFCLVSGSAEAVKLLRSCGARVSRMSKGPAREYRSASALIESIVPQVLEAAAMRLRHAGIATADVRAILEEQVAYATRSYLRTRKKPPLSDEIKRLAGRISSGDAVP